MGTIAAAGCRVAAAHYSQLWQAEYGWVTTHIEQRRWSRDFRQQRRVIRAAQRQHMHLWMSRQPVQIRLKLLALSAVNWVRPIYALCVHCCGNEIWRLQR